MSRLSVLIVNYNSWRVCMELLQSLQANPPLNADGTVMAIEVIVVDNCSPMREPEIEQTMRKQLAAMNGELILHQENGGYGKGMNLAYTHASGDLILVCNPDLYFQPGCIDMLLRHMETQPKTGAVAPEGYWDKGLQGRLPPNVLPTLGDLWRLTLAGLSPYFVRRYAEKRSREAFKVWDAKQDVRLPMLSGCCFLLRRTLIDEIGFFDERFPLYYEDTDLSMRIRRAGYEIVQVAGAKLVHYYNQSGQTDNELAMQRYWISRRLYYRKWYGRTGVWLYDMSRRILGSKWAIKRSKLSPHAQIHDLGAHKTKPVIEFTQPVGRVLVEVALDPNFYLAAAIFGDGQRWTVGDELFNSIGPMTYYFRALDVSASPAKLLGIYRYTRIPQDATEPEVVAGG